MKQTLILLLSLLLLASCGETVEQKKALTRQQRRELAVKDSLALKVGVMPTFDCLPLYVAEHSRLFDTLGVDVRLRRYTAQMDCDTALMRGRVEGSVSDLVRTERLRRKGMGLDYLTATDATWQLITNKASRLKKLSQMGDKMIAMTRFSATDLLTDQALKGVKTTAKVYRIQINDVNIRLNMLLNNELDAMWLPEPQATVARSAGHPVLTSSTEMGVNLGVFAFRTAAMKDARRREQLKYFCKAYDMAVDSLNAKGLRHYAQVLKKYYQLSDRSVDGLPKVSFRHITKPAAADIAKASSY